jgi:hypothetical protein
MIYGVTNFRNSHGWDYPVGYRAQRAMGDIGIIHLLEVGTYIPEAHA